MKRPKIQIELAEEQFLDQFTLIANHINSEAGWAKDYAGGCLFDVTGPELEYVKRFDPRKIWTLVEIKEGENQIKSGYHFANRIGFLLTIEPVEKDTSFCVRLPSNNE